MIFRPHMIMCWANGIALAFLFEARRKLYVLVLIAFLVPYTLAVSTQYVGKGETLEESFQSASQYREKIQESDTPDQMGGRTTIEGTPIPFVTGFVSLFLRPFPWRIHSVAAALYWVETYILLAMMLGGWWQLKKPLRRTLMRTFLVRASFFACIQLCIVFSYFTNVGLVTRQKMQVMPAILVLALSPALIRRSQQEAVKRNAWFASRAQLAMEGR